jgi:hypothetical protein
MRVQVYLLSAVCLWTVAVHPVVGEDPKDDHARSADKHPGLERFKALAGEWVGTGFVDGKEMPDLHVIYKVTSAGSTVVETLFAGTDHEMVSVIHPDGNSLVFTHYCALGNQPRMRADGKWDENKIAFKFADVTNLKSPKDPYMHDVTFTFIDKDNIKSEWTHYHDGAPGVKAVFEFKRKK